MASEKKWVLVSSRFDNGAHEAFVRATALKLKDMGLPIYIVEAGVGDRFGPMTMIGLLHMCAMLAFVSSEPPYGEKTESKYCTYHEVTTANENGVPIVAVQMGDTYPPVTGEDYGTAQNRYVFTQDLVRIDGRKKTEDDLAKLLYEKLCTIVPKNLLRAGSKEAERAAAEEACKPQGARRIKEAASKEAPKPAKADDEDDHEDDDDDNDDDDGDEDESGDASDDSDDSDDDDDGDDDTDDSDNAATKEASAPRVAQEAKKAAVKVAPKPAPVGAQETKEAAVKAPPRPVRTGPQEAKKAAAKEAPKLAKAEAPNSTAAEVPTPQRRSGGHGLTPTAAPAPDLLGTAKFQAH